MIFAITTLISALSISCIAAYFSIIGLATIFPGSTTSVVIMGSVLEVGKIIAALWLHRNWKLAPRLIKIYLMGAIIILMGITSMGIFGFLSKAHIEHQHTADKTQSYIAQLDTKIDREKEYISRQKHLIQKTESRVSSTEDLSQVNIEREKTKIKDLYEALEKSIGFDQSELTRLQSSLDKLDNEVADLEAKSGGLFSSKKKDLETLRERQKPERASISDQTLTINNRIQKARESTESQVATLRDKIEKYQDSEFGAEDSVAEDIEKYNKLIAGALDKIDELEKEKFSQQDRALQLEAEVGPIKYVADVVADFTGTEMDIGMAVRIVIIILIFVFDPLAVLLVLAAHISLMRKFPKLELNTEKIFEKQAKLQEEEKTLDNKEKDLIERRKDIEEQETLVDLKEKQIEKYQTQISEYKQSARESRIEAEKARLQAEDTSPVTEEIESLIAQKEKVRKEVESLKSEKSNILDKASNLKSDLREIKEVLGDQQKTRKTISELREEFNVGRKDMNKLKLQIENLEEQNFNLLKENQNLKDAQEPILEQLPDSKWRVSIKSSKGGTHQFSRVLEFTKADVLNMQAIAEYLDEMAPERTTPILQASYETNVRKFLDQRMDNREYSKKRPQYNFKA